MIPVVSCFQSVDMNTKVPAKKKDDAAFDVEQQFILRLPPVRLLLPIRLISVNRISIYVISVYGDTIYLMRHVSVE